jgi:hypothetical protein
MYIYFVSEQLCSISVRVSCPQEEIRNGDRSNMKKLIGLNCYIVIFGRKERNKSFTQPLTEMGTRNIKIIMFLGSKVRLVRKADNLTAFLFQCVASYCVYYKSKVNNSHLTQCVMSLLQSITRHVSTQSESSSGVLKTITGNQGKL